MELSWQPNTHNDPRRWREGPVDQPPWADRGQAPIPPYAPPPPGTWTPQDTPSATSGPPLSQPHLHGAPQHRLRYAEWGERLTATLLDGLLIFAGVFVLSFVTFGAASGLAGMAWLAGAGYVAWLNGSKGQSPGKAMMGLKLLRDDDGSTLGGPAGLVRAFTLWGLGVFSLGLLWLVAVLWPLWDRRKQALHDKIFGATVVSGYPRARSGKDIFRP